MEYFLPLNYSVSEAFRAAGESLPVATKPAWWHPLFWWRNDISYRFVVSELQKNIYYLLAYY